MEFGYYTPAEFDSKSNPLNPEGLRGSTAPLESHGPLLRCLRVGTQGKSKWPEPPSGHRSGKFCLDSTLDNRLQETSDPSKTRIREVRIHEIHPFWCTLPRVSEPSIRNPCESCRPNDHLTPLHKAMIRRTIDAAP